MLYLPSLLILNRSQWGNLFEVTSNARLLFDITRIPQELNRVVRPGGSIEIIEDGDHSVHIASPKLMN